MTLPVATDAGPLAATATRIATDTGVCDARDHGIAGDGTANGQPALQGLVDALGAAVADDGRPRMIYCPGRSTAPDRTTT